MVLLDGFFCQLLLCLKKKHRARFVADQDRK